MREYVIRITVVEHYGKPMLDFEVLRHGELVGNGFPAAPLLEGLRRAMEDIAEDYEKEPLEGDR